MITMLSACNISFCRAMPRTSIPPPMELTNSVKSPCSLTYFLLALIAAMPANPLVPLPDWTEPGVTFLGDWFGFGELFGFGSGFGFGMVLAMVFVISSSKLGKLVGEPDVFSVLPFDCVEEVPDFRINVGFFLIGFLLGIVVTFLFLLFLFFFLCHQCTLLFCTTRMIS